MGVKTRVSKWGTSLAIRIPKSIAEQWGIHEGIRYRAHHTGRPSHIGEKFLRPKRLAGTN